MTPQSENVGGVMRQLDGAFTGNNLEAINTPDGPKKKRIGRTNAGDKSGKGLRHFSMKVCEKVESKGRTTYNEVADELVAEFSSSEGLTLGPDQQYDEKNIRRRVYDALNVLMAMDIIAKEKKEIQWKGLPYTSGAGLDLLQAECAHVRESCQKKLEHLQELQEQVTGLENLIRRNKAASQSSDGEQVRGGVALPFMLVQTPPQATVEVEISSDMQLVHFDFGSTSFQLHYDLYVLKKMGLCCPLSDTAAPKAPTSSMSDPPPPQYHFDSSQSSPRAPNPVKLEVPGDFISGRPSS